MNIYEKLLNIENEIKTVTKNLEVGTGKNKYKAVSEADVLSAAKELEFKYKVYSYPYSRKVIDNSILETVKEYDGNITKGNQLFMRLEVVYRFVNAEKPAEIVDITTYGDGIDTQDKGPGKAMTYADKYALLKAYKIVTGEDPDQSPSPENVTYDSEKDSEKLTLDDAKKYIFNFGKYKEEKLIDIFKTDYSYLEFLLKKGKADYVLKKCIELLNEEAEEKLKLLSIMQQLEEDTNSNHEEILKYFKVKSDVEMNIEQLKSCIFILEKKLPKTSEEKTPYDF